MKYMHVFNSDLEKPKKELHIACGFISTSYILLEKESIILKVEAIGEIEFLNVEEEVLCKAKVDRQVGGSKCYEEIYLTVDSGIITIDFPIYEWFDNYPNCDGEYDRWDTKTIGYRSIKYSLELNKCI